MKHLALAKREIDDHAVAALDLVEISVARLTEQRFCSKPAVLVAEELVLERNVGALLDLACHADREHLEAIRRAAGGGGIGQAAADLEVEPVDLVAVDMAVGAKQIAIV